MDSQAQQVAGRPGTQILCGRCGQLLALSLGDRLDCFAFTVDHRMRLKCETCRYVTKWGPDNSTSAVDPTQAAG